MLVSKRLYGCNTAMCGNEPKPDGYYAPDRHYFQDGRFEVRNTYIPFTMSQECRYVAFTEGPDPGCDGCEKEKKE